MADELPPQAGELYALPLGEFIGARDELAKQLRANDPSAAAAVKKLRKPTVPAWAIDQLVRQKRPAIDDLFEAGKRLRDAQRALVRGGDARAVQEAATAERGIVTTLVSAATKILKDAGLNASVAYQEAIANTLYATATDEDVRAAVEAGRVDRDHTRVGFGDMPDLTLVPPPARGKPESKQDERARDRERKAEARARWKELVKASREAESAAARAEREAGEAEAAARRARTHADALREAADEARADAEEAAEVAKD